MCLLLHAFRNAVFFVRTDATPDVRILEDPRRDEMSDQEIRDNNLAVYRARLNSVDEAMERLGVGRSTVFGLVRSGQLRSVKVGRRRLIPEQALVDFIDGLVTA
jgi:excisionase family DNA binding protein